MKRFVQAIAFGAVCLLIGSAAFAENIYELRKLSEEDWLAMNTEERLTALATSTSHVPNQTFLGDFGYNYDLYKRWGYDFYEMEDRYENYSFRDFEAYNLLEERRRRWSYNEFGDRISRMQREYNIWSERYLGDNTFWVWPTDNFINGAPSTDGTHVIFGGCDEILHIVSVSDGTKTGEVWAGSYIPGSAAIVDNQAYLGHYDNQLVAIDLMGKKVIWKYEDKEHPGPFFSSPAVTKDRVVIGSRDGYMHCVDRNLGEKIWDFQTLDEIDGSPVIAGEKVIFGSIDGRLYIVNLKNGEKIWSYEIGAALIGCPAVAGGFIVIGSEDGRVYSFGEKS